MEELFAYLNDLKICYFRGNFITGSNILHTKISLFRTLSLYRPHAKTLDNASREKKDHHGPKIIWFIPADKRLPLVAVPIKHAPENFVKYHEEYKNRIFIVILVIQN